MNNNDLIIKNGIIVNSKTQFKGSILVNDGKISAILKPGEEENYQGDKVIDAKGRYLIPGGVDGHTHMMDPGFTEREEFETGTAAAAFGGITTIIDHHRTIPNVHSVQEHLEKVEYL